MSTTPNEERVEATHALNGAEADAAHACTRVDAARAAHRELLAAIEERERAIEQLRVSALEATEPAQRVTAVEMLNEVLAPDAEREKHEQRVRAELGTAEAWWKKTGEALAQARARFERAVRAGGA